MQKQKVILFAISLGLLALLMNILLMSLHRYSNSAPEGHMLARVQQAYYQQTLLQNEYPGYGPPFSLKALVGQVHYTECQMALITLVSPDSSIRGALLPKKVSLEPDNKHHCRMLHGFAKNPEHPDFQIREARSRYLWGGGAIMGISLRFLSVFQMKEAIKKATNVSIFLLTVGLALISTRTLLMLSPLIAFTIMFSGTTFYSDVSFGMPFLWSILGPAILAFLIAAKRSLLVTSIWVFLCGCASSFIWMIDGHTLQMVTWLVLLSYFGTTEHGKSIRYSYLSSGVAVSMYGLGFSLTYIINQLLKSYYLGFSNVWRSFRVAVINRSSGSTNKEPDIELFPLLERLWENGVQITGFVGHGGLANAVLVSSAVALIVGLILAIRSAYQSGLNSKILTSNILLLLVMGHFLARFLLTQNHSWILPHSHFVGRYLFIVLALCWVSLIVGVIYRGNRHGR